MSEEAFVKAVVDTHKCHSCAFNSKSDYGPMMGDVYCDLDRRVNLEYGRILRYQQMEAPDWCPARGGLLITGRGDA